MHLPCSCEYTLRTVHLLYQLVSGSFSYVCTTFTKVVLICVFIVTQDGKIIFFGVKCPCMLICSVLDALAVFMVGHAFGSCPRYNQQWVTIDDRTSVFLQKK